MVERTTPPDRSVRSIHRISETLQFFESDPRQNCMMSLLPKQQQTQLNKDPQKQGSTKANEHPGVSVISKINNRKAIQRTILPTCEKEFHYVWFQRQQCLVPKPPSTGGGAAQTIENEKTCESQKRKPLEAYRYRNIAFVASGSKQPINNPLRL